MYYKSLFELLKDEAKDRIIVKNEISLDSEYRIEMDLLPKDINICPQCGSTNIIKFGKKDRTIRDDYISNRPTFITIYYNRLKCKDCHKMYNDTLQCLHPESISMSLKLNILEDLKHDITFTTIANRRNTSVQTVIDIFESYVSFDRVPFGDVVCMDEFKNLKHSKGKYAFVMYDPNAHVINDILEDRLQENIDHYLYQISWKEKEKVKYVITDMSESYASIIRRHFPRATHIIDTFHFLRYVEDALNDVRIRVQSEFGENTKEYRILKKHWRILSTYYLDVEDRELYNNIRKKSTSIQEIIDDSLALSPDLEEAYTLTQKFLQGVREVKYEEANEWITQWIDSLKESRNKEFQKLAGMFSNWKNEIINSFIRFGEKKLHNGYIEGMNNKIKVIKRIAYGYTNFTHFRNRIMYIVNSNYVLKMVDRTKIPRKPRKKNKS